MALTTNTARLTGVAFALALAAGCTKQEAAAPPPPPPMAACVTHQVHFATGGILMEPGDITSINATTSEARGPNAKVMLVGKADRVGTEAANKELSKRRAELVRKALIDNGVLASKIAVSYTGEDKPEVQTKDQQAELLNRVVLITVVDNCRMK